MSVDVNGAWGLVHLPPEGCVLVVFPTCQPSWNDQAALKHGHCELTVWCASPGHLQKEIVYKNTPISPQMTRMTQPSRRAERRLLGTKGRMRRLLLSLRQSKGAMLCVREERGFIGSCDGRVQVEQSANSTVSVP